MRLGKNWVAMLAVCAGLAWAGTAGAAVVLNETFTYPDGNLTGQGGWTQTGTGTLANTIQVSSNKVPLLNNGQDVYTALSSTVAHTDGNGLYTGVDINVSAAQASGDYFLHVSDPLGTTSNFYQRLFAKSSGAGYVLGMLETSGTGGAVEYGTTVLNLNTTYRVVVAWNFLPGATNDTFSLYVSPTSGTEGANTAYLTHTWSSVTGEPAQIAAANLRQGSASLAPTESVDNLIVATTFSEAAAVPEPASVGLAVGAVGLLASRRRRA